MERKSVLFGISCMFVFSRFDFYRVTDKYKGKQTLYRYVGTHSTQHSGYIFMQTGFIFIKNLKMRTFIGHNLSIATGQYRLQSTRSTQLILMPVPPNCLVQVISSTTQWIFSYANRYHFPHHRHLYSKSTNASFHSSNTTYQLPQESTGIVQITKYTGDPDARASILSSVHS